MILWSAWSRRKKVKKIRYHMGKGRRVLRRNDDRVLGHWEELSKKSPEDWSELGKSPQRNTVGKLCCMGRGVRTPRKGVGCERAGGALRGVVRSVTCTQSRGEEPELKGWRSFPPRRLGLEQWLGLNQLEEGERFFLWGMSLNKGQDLHCTIW